LSGYYRLLCPVGSHVTFNAVHTPDRPHARKNADGSNEWYFSDKTRSLYKHHGCKQHRMFIRSTSKRPAEQEIMARRAKICPSNPLLTQSGEEIGRTASGGGALWHVPYRAAALSGRRDAFSGNTPAFQPDNSFEIPQHCALGLFISCYCPSPRDPETHQRE
jgi:hypothetical protein